MAACATYQPGRYSEGGLPVLQLMKMKRAPYDTVVTLDTVLLKKTTTG